MTASNILTIDNYFTEQHKTDQRVPCKWLQFQIFLCLCEHLKQNFTLSSIILEEILYYPCRISCCTGSMMLQFVLFGKKQVLYIIIIIINPVLQRKMAV